MSCWHSTTRPAAWIAWGLLLAAVASACSFIRFERGPYVIRDLQVVVSEQEGVTFFVWQLREDADLDRVHFEIRRRGSYRDVDLGEAPFPAEPYPCRGNRICFQYQVRGSYESPDQAAPLRSVHDSHGAFASPDPDFHRVDSTFDIDPVAVERNEVIETNHFDWFARENIPMKRAFQWRFTPREGDECEAGGGRNWRRLEGDISVDGDWTDDPVCLAGRPRPSNASAHVERRPLPPSAVTYNERQTYVPERLEPPIVYGILFDMAIPSSTRCEEVRTTIVSTLESTMEEEGETRKLGVFTPISTESGDTLSGCRQESGRRYPLTQMYREAERVQATEAPPELKVVWIYVNNIQLEPDERIVDQLERLTQTAPTENNLDVYNWGIGSNDVLSTVQWDQRTGWRPIGDETFTADLEAFVRRAFPFSTMDHESDTEVPIREPAPLPEDEEPKAFKICEASPFPVRAVGIESGRARYDVTSPFVPWPEEGQPFYHVQLPRQELVFDANYDEYKVNVVVEACVRFCDHQFRDRSGQIHDSWKAPGVARPMEVCQWVD